MSKINSKIPGSLPTPPRTEIDGKVTDLPSKPLSELIELRDRQEKLLSNKLVISKLPDEGTKIKTFLDKINNELEAKQVEELTFSSLSKVKLDKKSVQDIEWKTNIATDNKDAYLDSDDDSEPENVFQILSQGTASQRNVKILPPDKPLVTPIDLENIDEVPDIKFIVDKTENKPKPNTSGELKPYKTTESDVHDPNKEILRKKDKNWEITAATPPPIIHGPSKPLVTPIDLGNIDEVPHIKFIVDKTENKPKPNTSGEFKPHKTTKSDVHDPNKEILRKKHKNWEVTAATPPPIIHGPSKLLSLQESLVLQKEYNNHIKEIEAKHATEQLLLKSGIKMPQLPDDVSVFGNYREICNEDSEESDDEGSEKEVHDEEPERGGVIFTVMK